MHATHRDVVYRNVTIGLGGNCKRTDILYSSHIVPISQTHTQWNFVLTAFRNVIGDLLPLEDLLGATLACGQCREGHQAKQNLAQHPELMQDHSGKLTLIAVDRHC